MADSVAVPDALLTIDDAAEQMVADGLSRCLGRPARIVDLVSRPLRSYSSHPISRLVATLDDGTRCPVIFKSLQPHLSKEVRREVLVYERILCEGRTGAPTLYASCCDDAQERYWLMVEDVGGARLQWCDVDEWERAFRWLAHLHTTYAGRESELAATECLDEHGSAFYYRLAEAASRSLHDHGAAGPAARLERLCGRSLDAAVMLLAEQPRTLVHGDLSCHNVMVQPEGIRALDWEWAAIGPAAWDVAKLLAGWGSGKRRLLRVYLGELTRLREPPDRDGMASAVVQCEAMQTLWYLWWWIEPCGHPGVVNRMLGRVERRWARLDMAEG